MYLQSDVQLNSYLNPAYYIKTLRIDLVSMLHKTVVPMSFSVIKNLLSNVIKALTTLWNPNSKVKEVSDIYHIITSFV
jgi:hypothetical protein